MIDPDLLRISVREAAPLRGNELRPAAGHGLGAVDAMASRRGVEPLGALDRLGVGHPEQLASDGDAGHLSGRGDRLLRAGGHPASPGASGT